MLRFAVTGRGVYSIQDSVGKQFIKAQDGELLLTSDPDAEAIFLADYPYRKPIKIVKHSVRTDIGNIRYEIYLGPVGAALRTFCDLILSLQYKSCVSPITTALNL